jgi:hypothetical protein
MKTTEAKTEILKKYEALCEKSLPGKGAMAKQIASKYWDSSAEEMTAFRLTIDLSITDNLVLQVLKDLATRFPQMNEEIKALKNS